MKELPENLSLINNETGEVYPIDVLHKPGAARWEKVYAKSLADMLEITGDEKTQVIAYLIRKKDYQNRVIATMREIADSTGVSLKTVNRTMQTLKKNNYILKIRNGLWRFSPHVMMNGKASIGAAVIRMYDDTDHKNI